MAMRWWEVMQPAPATHAGTAQGLKGFYKKMDLLVRVIYLKQPGKMLKTTKVSGNGMLHNKISYLFMRHNPTDF